MSRKALITGITGQDGAYLAKLLLEKGYEVYGTIRRTSTPNLWRLQYLGIVDKITLTPCEITDMSGVMASLRIIEPDEVYHLAAMSYVGASFENPIATMEINATGTAIVLEAVKQACPDARVFIACSSEMYGRTGIEVSRPLREDDFFKPMSPYATSKLAAYWLGKIYREAYGLYVVNGIMFNHESPLRGLEFVTRKISNEVAKIALGLSKELRLGNLEAKRDWGYAPEYMEGVWLMMQQKEPDDYILATGEAHSVREFVVEAFRQVGIDDWERYVKIDPSLLRKLDVPCLIGDYTKARERLGWRPRVRFVKLVNIMVEEDLARWEKWVNGETFPWDAPLYPSEAKILIKTITH